MEAVSEAPAAGETRQRTRARQAGRRAKATLSCSARRTAQCPGCALSPSCSTRNRRSDQSLLREQGTPPRDLGRSREPVLARTPSCRLPLASGLGSTARCCTKGSSEHLWRAQVRAEEGEGRTHPRGRYSGQTVTPLAGARGGGGTCFYVLATESTRAWRQKRRSAPREDRTLDLGIASARRSRSYL